MDKKTLSHRLEDIHEKLKELDKKCKAFPEGNIQFSKNGSHYKWYVKKGDKRIYIKKKDREFARKLALKMCIQAEMEDLKKEALAIKAYLYHYDSDKSKVKLVFEHEGLLELMRDETFSISDELKLWENEPYQKNFLYPEHLVHRDIRRRLYRSKTEASIATFLYTENIPFRYECELIVNNIQYFPDFTIRHPETGELYYWEHLGLVDDPKYFHKNIDKLHKFYNSGLIPSKNLIVTFETKDNPLSIDNIQAEINKYFK